MVSLVLQMFDTLSMGSIYLFSTAMLLVIFSWLLKVIQSWRYRPVAKTNAAPTVGVIIPVVHEDIGLFKEVCLRIVNQSPDKVVVVINGQRDLDIEEVCKGIYETNPQIFQYVWLPKSGKRYAIAEGIKYLDTEITVLVDSDTLWDKDCLVNLVTPFQDSNVGGVTGDQRIFRPNRNLFTRWADWFELLRSSYSLPAMSVGGEVGCLPGRTIAYRTSIIKDNLNLFLTDKFLGTHLEISDDRALTNYALKSKYKTVFQSTSSVTTDAPTSFIKLVRQQYRWAKGSQYNSLKMFWWMLTKKPFLWFLYVVDILVPLLLTANLLSWILGSFLVDVSNKGDFFRALKIVFFNGLLGLGIFITCAVLASWAAYGVRTSRVIDRKPSTFWLLPVFMFLNFTVLVPIRTLGLLTCAWGGTWGTRRVEQLTRYKERRITDIRQLFPTIFGILVLAALTYWGIYF